MNNNTPAWIEHLLKANEKAARKLAARKLDTSNLDSTFDELNDRLDNLNRILMHMWNVEESY